FPTASLRRSPRERYPWAQVRSVSSSADLASIKTAALFSVYVFLTGGRVLVRPYYLADDSEHKVLRTVEKISERVPFRDLDSAWGRFWHTIAGWAERAWNAVTAVWAFFVAAGKWLATAFMSYVKGLTTGDWTDFQNNVLKPLRKALEAVISFILDLVRAVFKPISDAIAAFLRALANGVLNVWARVIDEISKANPSAPYHGGVAGAILSIVLFGGGIIAIYAFCLGLAYAGAIAKPWYFVMGLIVAVLIGSIVFGVMDLLHAGYPAPTPQANNALYDPKFGPDTI